MSYQIIIKKPVKKFMDRLPAGERKRLVAAKNGFPGLAISSACKGRRMCFACGLGTTAFFSRWTTAR